MFEPYQTLALAAAALAGLAIVTFAGLRAWAGWLELRRLEIGRPLVAASGAGTTGARIELADLRERVRKLEAIAAGVEL